MATRTDRRARLGCTVKFLSFEARGRLTPRKAADKDWPGVARFEVVRFYDVPLSRDMQLQVTKADILTVSFQTL